jgi:seryl-tRNA synthetase
MANTKKKTIGPVIINAKKKDVARFVTRVELDKEMKLLAKKLEDLSRDHLELCRELGEFMGRYNENVKRTNEAFSRITNAFGNGNDVSEEFSGKTGNG